MMRLNRVSAAIGTALLASSLVACSDRAEREGAEVARETGNAAERVGESAKDATGNVVEAAGDAVINAGRAADAAVETLDVKTALSADSRVDAGGINVDTDQVTKIVTLKGHVPTAEQKVLAERIAVEKAVGYRVKNELTVGQ